MPSTMDSRSALPPPPPQPDSAAAAAAAGAAAAATAQLDYNLLAYREKRLKLLKQQSLRQNSRILKLKRSNFLYFFNLLAICVLQIIAIYFFKLGFLLSRLVLPNVSSLNDTSYLLNHIPQHSLLYYNTHFGNNNNIQIQPPSNYLFQNELAHASSASASASASSSSSLGWIQPKFKKSIIVVIDALRFDFVIPIDQLDPNYNPNYHNNFPLLYNLYANHSQNAALFKFVADPPTTTLQRLKGLTTGSLPTFIDAGSNFDGDEINEDNIVYQLHQNANSNVSLIGDDTWDSLFRPYLNTNLSWPYESLNVWDIHTVDDGVLQHLFPLLNQSNPDSQHWQTIVAHFLGMDHVGHRYGPDNFEMVNKQRQMDAEMSRLIHSIDNETLLVIMGDHGMDPTGNHGGDSKPELESTLFLYSKQPAFTSATNAFSSSSSSSSHKYTLHDLDTRFQPVTQIDFVPSFSLLMGIPIPFNNLGKPINALHTDPQLSELENLKNLVKVNYLNILNLQRYKLTLISKTNDLALKDQSLFKEFLDIYANYTKIDNLLKQQQPDYTTTASQNVSLQELNILLDSMVSYQNRSLALFNDIWAKFNNFYIYVGITLMAFSLVILVLLAKIIPSIVFNQLVTEFLTIIVLMIFFWLIIINAIYFVLKPSIFSLFTINLLAVAVGIIFGFLIIIFDRYNITWLVKQFRFFVNDVDASWSFISLVFLVIMFISYSSNSFIIFQDTIINFLLINYGLYNLWVFARALLVHQRATSKVAIAEQDESNSSSSSSSDEPATHHNELAHLQTRNRTREKIRLLYGLTHSVSFVVIQKLNSLIKTCREEQSNHCPKLITNTNGQSSCKTTNNFTLTALGLLFLVNFIFPKILELFLNIGNVNSYQNSAKLWIGTFLRLVLFANWGYWLLDYLEFHQDFNSMYFNLSFNTIKSLKLTIARVVMGICLVAGNFAWSKGPLCIKLVFPEKPKSPPASAENNNNNNDSDSSVEYANDEDEANRTGKTKIVGYDNIYGSSYLLLVLNFFGAILITSKPYASISLMLLVYQILSVLELVNLLDLRNNMVGPIILNLLAYSFFYSGGHQITINSIKWELAFQLSDSIVFPVSHIPLILNSFGPFILTGLCIVLITIWKIPPNLKPISLLSKIIVNCLTLLMSQTVVTLSSLIFTNFFKRHLMVWKIFVPCFLFNSLILVCLNLVILFISFFFGVTKLIHQINRIFGK